MKRNLFLLSAVVGLLLTACDKNEFGASVLSNQTVSASLPDLEGKTRTVLNGLQVVWSSGDKISVFAQNGTVITNNLGTIKTGVGTTSASFNVVLEGTTKLAASYPYMSSVAYDGNVISMTLPDSYTYSENGISGAPMAALINDQSSSIAFKNAGALMGITVNNIPAGYNQAILKSNGTEAITGDCEIAFDSEGKPTIKATEAATGKIITINFEESSAATNKTFYFPIPVNNYTELQISISNGSDEIVLKTKGLNAERSKRYKSTLTLDVVSGETPVEAVGTAEATEKLQSSNSVSVTIPNTEENPTISLPEATENNPVSLSFESIPEGKTVTINATTEDVNVAETVSISASSDDNSNNEFDIQLPKSTVTLNANGETATYNKVTAHTSANTLIVGNGVTVNTLLIKGGNVRVYGIIEYIERLEENIDEQTIIFLEEGAEIPELTDNKFLVIKDEAKWDGESYYAPAYDEESKTYFIKNAYHLAWIANIVNSGNSLTGYTVSLENDIDLNNKNWTPIGFNSKDEAGNEPYFSGTFNGNEYTINNLKIDLKDKGGVGLFGVVYNATFKNFTLNNIDIKSVESEDDPANSSGAEGKANYIVGGHMGAIVGYDTKTGILNFENVHLTGLIKIEGETRAAQGQRIGGIIGGRSSSTVTFQNVTIKGDTGSYIKGYCSTAGISGQLQGAATYENVHTDIDVYAVTFGAGGIAGIARHGSTFTNCSSAGNITLDASKTQLSSYSANYPYRVGGIAGCWSEGGKTGVLTLTDCSYTGTLTSIDKDGKTPEVFDYAGYVGRGYGLNSCQGSTVTIDDINYVQAFDEAANSGIYYVDGVLTINSVANFKVFASKVNSGITFAGKNVVLGADIDLKNEEWTPIGTETNNFEGNFDGKNKVVKNLKITTHASITDAYGTWAYAGLFGVTCGAENQCNSIKNLVIENINISNNGDIVAAAVAYPYYTDIENITIKGDINIKGGNYTAGILGYTRRCVNAKDLTIEGNEGSSIEGNSTVGGVISDIQMNGGLTANYSNFRASGLKITAKSNVGGISGIICEQTLDGATVNDIEIISESSTRGTISGALGGESTIKNISVTNVTGATNIVGAMYETGADVVQNGDVFYSKVCVTVSTEQELRTAIATSDEITLGADITLSNYIEIRDVNVVINLNDHTITHPSTSSAGYKDVFEVYGTGVLTINGEGKVIAEDGYSIYAAGNSKVYLNGGYYFSPVSAVDARKNAVVTINGGEFKVDGTDNSDGDYGQKYTLNLRDKKDSYISDLSNIIVKGGKFYKYNPAESHSEPEVTNFVAEGYSSVKEGDYYIVSKN